MLRRTAGIALALLALAAAACGDDDGPEEGLIIGDTLSVYSSLPLRGPYAEVARDVARAQKLALKEAGGRAGEYSINFTMLDSAEPETGRWSPGKVAANARKAVQDRQTIAYLGELESGASAISVPILNEGGILQVSPGDTFGGLTTTGSRGEPDKYYPSGMRTFARTVPGDDAQAREVVAALVASRVRRVVLADDRELAGSSLGDRIDRLARAAGIEVVDRMRLEPDDDPEDGIEVPRSLVREVRAERADGFVYAGTYRPFAVEVLKAIHAAHPEVALFGADDLALAPGLPAEAGVVARQLTLTAIQPPDGPDARAFARAYEAEYAEEPHPQAVFGYQAMQVVLDAVRRSGANASSRRTVIRAALGRPSATQGAFGRFRLEGSRLVPARSPL